MKKKMDEQLKVQMRNVMHIAYFVAKKERPFTDFTSQLQLCARTGGAVPKEGWYDSDKAGSGQVTSKLLYYIDIITINIILNIKHYQNY